MNILINSTNYLLPNNKNWEVLKKNNELNFSTYGSLDSRKKNSIDVDITLIFLPDIIDYYKSNDKSYNSEVLKVSALLKLIKKKLGSKNRKFIIGVSEFFYNNTVNISKKNNYTKKIKNFFLNELYKISKNNNNLFIIDVDDIYAEHGFKNCFDQRNFYMFRCRLSTLGIEIISEKLNEIIIKFNTTSKKVLLLDCDNTIWGGVIAEDGIENIKIGQDGEGSIFVDFQKAIKKIKDSGVLISLVSKNNKSDVENVLKNHDSMILKKKDIAIMKIDWNDKAENIKKIAKELSLNLNSFIYWDDNPLERENIRSKLKDVEVVEPDLDLVNWPKQLLELTDFSKFIVTKEDKLKTNQYKIREKFVKNSLSSKNYLSYLKSIKIKPSILKINKSTLSRAAQLSQKTNQFNFRTKNYSISEILNLDKNRKNICFLVHLKDSYGDHGIVSFICLKTLSNKYLFIDTFLMSCRILGRNLEYWILNEIRKIALKKKISSIISEYIPSSRNQVAKKFILKSNFKKISKNKILINDNFFKKMINTNKNSEYYSMKNNVSIKNLEIYAKKR